MQPFELCLPTKIVFGEGTVKKLGGIAREFGKKVFLLTYDKIIMEQTGILGQVLDSLKREGLEVIEFFGVKSNPTIEHAREAIAIVKKEKPNVIIALGGGSVMDEAKAIGIGACSDADIWDLATGKANIGGSVPLITVVTIPATSSEMNATSVMSNDALQRKEGFVHPSMYPKISVLDPTLTYSIPLKQTAYSAADIISHLFEGYLMHTDPFVPMQNRYCEGMAKTIMDCMDILLDDPKNAQARAMMMWAATYAWNGFYVCGIGPLDNPIHILGHSFSAFYDLPHGAAMAITILATLKYHVHEKTERFARMAREIMGVYEEDDLKAAQKGTELLSAWFQKIGAPVNFAQAGMPADELDKLAEDALLTAKMWGMESYWTKERAMDMLKLCL